MKKHHYTTLIEWTGNLGKGTKSYGSYSRDHRISAAAKTMDILASSDPSFRGDPKRYNPEELFLSSLSACHMLWYLHLCSSHNIVVISYKDEAKGQMQEAADGSGQFTQVCLYPQVEVQEAEMIALAEELHTQANKMCFIANSCNFPVLHEARTFQSRKSEVGNRKSEVGSFEL